LRCAGKRRALIPPEAGYVSETLKPIPEEVQCSSAVLMRLYLYDTAGSPSLFLLLLLLGSELQFGPRRSLLSHAKEPLVFEVQLLKVL
jgi:hypothetical protein